MGHLTALNSQTLKIHDNRQTWQLEVDPGALPCFHYHTVIMTINHSCDNKPNLALIDLLNVTNLAAGS